jgi:hypothetical protein
MPPNPRHSVRARGLELIYKVNLKLSVFFAYQGFQAPETVLSGFPESLVLREFQRLNKSALKPLVDQYRCVSPADQIGAGNWGLPPRHKVVTICR